LVVLFLCAPGSEGFAQNNPTPAKADKSVISSPKTSTRKAARKNSKPLSPGVRVRSEEAEEADRLAEARRKFFEQSNGFENKDTDRALSLGGSSGLSPGWGFKF
jgi:hypothetical protein